MRRANSEMSLLDVIPTSQHNDMTSSMMKPAHSSVDINNGTANGHLPSHSHPLKSSPKYNSTANINKYVCKEEGTYTYVFIL